MKSGNWIPIDKSVVYFFPHDRPYSDIEALLSYAIDLDNSKKGTINGYAKQWSWGRKKVRKFLEDLGTPREQGRGHQRHRRGTHKEHAIVLKINNLEDQRHNKGTGEGTPKEQGAHREGDTTIYPKPNPEPKPKTKDKKNIYGEYKKVRLTKDEYQRLEKDYSLNQLLSMIKILDEYKETSGKTYKNDNLVLRGWVLERVKKGDNGSRKISANEQRLIDKGIIDERQ